MIQVRCEGCSAPFSVDERRVPTAGMRVRCPKCAGTFRVTATGDVSAFEATAAAPTRPPSSPEPPAKPSAPALELNLEAELPAPASSDLPAPARPPALRPVAPAPPFPSPKPVARPPAPAAAAPSAPPSDLPSPRRMDPAPQDLPAPARPPAAAAVRAPTPARPRVPTPAPPAPGYENPDVGDLDLDFEIDLPALATGTLPAVDDELPAVFQNMVELPAPSRADPMIADLPARPRASTAKDLPVDLPARATAPAASHDLPRPAPDPGLPTKSPSQGGASGENDLPAGQTAGPPAPVANLPARPRAPVRSFGEIDLPATSALQARPGENLPSVSGLPPAVDLPSSGDAPVPTFDDSLDLDLPLPPSADESTAPSPDALPDLDLPGPPLDSPAPFAVQSAGLRLGAAIRERPPSRKLGPRARALVRTAIGAGVLLVAGAALTPTPAGPFGARWIDDKLHGAQRHAAAVRVIDAARRALEHDTYGASLRALRDIEQQWVRTPGERDLPAFGAYVAACMVVRFGPEPSLVARARSLYEQSVRASTGSAYLAAARAAHDLADNHGERISASASNNPLIRDLRTQALLDARETEAAVQQAREAVRRQPTVRARYLEARALDLAEDRAGAVQSAELVLQAQPDHAGARLLLARLLAARADGVERALGYAGEVLAMDDRASIDERAEAAALMGQVELSRDHAVAAREAFDRAIAIDPRSTAALDGLASLLLRQGHAADALARFQAAHHADEGDIDAIVGIAMASLALDEAREARESLEPVVAQRPDEPRLRYWLARSLLALGESSAAERELRESLRLDNTSLDTYTTLASLLFSLQRPAAAESILQDARAHVSDQAAIHRALAEGRIARGDLESGASELVLAVQARPDDLRSRFLFAQTLRRLRRFDEAVVQIAEGQRIDADHAGLRLERGLLAEARGDFAGALAMFREALARDPGNPEIVVRVASVLVASGQYAEAQTMVRAVVAEHAERAEAHFVYGRALFGLGDATTAAREFRRAVELDTARAEYRAFAAEAAVQLGQFAAALEEAERAISLDANGARAYWVRAEVRVRSGAAVQGLADAQSALRLDPSFAPALATLADADESLGHLREAIELYQRAVTLEPDRGAWHARLGQLLADRGREPEALVAVERATALGDAMNPPPEWLAPAHRQAGDLCVHGARERARAHYQRFVDLATPSTPGLADVRGRLAELTRP